MLQPAREIGARLPFLGEGCPNRDGRFYQRCMVGKEQTDENHLLIFADHVIFKQPNFHVELAYCLVEAGE